MKPLIRQLNLDAGTQAGLFDTFLPHFIQSLRERLYAKETISQYVSTAKAFGKWLQSEHLTGADADEQTVARYRATLPRRSTVTNQRGRLPRAGIGLSHLLCDLRQQGVLMPVQVPTTTVDLHLAQYQQYLANVLGLAVSTQHQYLSLIRSFLSPIIQEPLLDWAWMNTTKITDFICHHAQTHHGKGRQAAAVAIRSWLRFMVGQGMLRAGLELCIPRIPTQRHAALPVTLTAEEINRILDTCDQSTVSGRRNFTIFLMLARLGMRSGEIIRLRLDDIDWHSGQILVQAGKTRRQRRLPLSMEVGEAIVRYLPDRPHSSHRTLFLSQQPPFVPLQHPSALSHLVARTLKRAGIRNVGGAHLFRHTAATHMVCRGASFKDVADVLGHQSLQTTAIYAKLDLAALAEMAQPWPGGGL